MSPARLPVPPPRHEAEPNYGTSSSLRLRDGELIVYRRSRSARYQCRFRLASGAWCRLSTHCLRLEDAIAQACLRYDQVRFRQHLGLAHRAQSVAHLGTGLLAELAQQVEAHPGKHCSAEDYQRCLRRDILPYFGERYLEDLTAADIAQFESWRNRQLRQAPKTSTLRNYAAAWNRLIDYAHKTGSLSLQAQVPRLTVRGVAGRARAAFTAEEVTRLLAHMAVWRGGSQRRMEADMRPLVCDYAQFLLYTGIRQGTEAMRLCWHHLAWHWVDGQRYLRVWVDGKTGGRWLIARQAAIEVLERCHQRQQDIQHLSFEELFTQRVRHRVFRFATGYQPKTFIGAFRRLLIDGGLLEDHDGRRRTLYSLRHTYATLALVSGDVDIHTLSRQMGTSVAMLERHYSKLTATMAAAKLGWDVIVFK